MDGNKKYKNNHFVGEKHLKNNVLLIFLLHHRTFIPLMSICHIRVDIQNLNRQRNVYKCTSYYIPAYFRYDSVTMMMTIQ